jgi:Cdc6-like AAA superfamily ATPase
LIFQIVIGQWKAIVKNIRAGSWKLNQVKLRGVTQRAFSDLVSKLDIYGFIQSRIISKGRYGRCREISSNLPPQVTERLKQALLLAFDLGSV